MTSKGLGKMQIAAVAEIAASLGATGLEGKRLGDHCGVCGTKLQVLFSGLYCPRDCDKPDNVAKRAKEDEERMQRIADWNKAMAEQDENAKTWPGGAPGNGHFPIAGYP